MVIVKKYSNRRLYDTEQSCYITLEELAARIRGGADVRVVDAKSGADLTQATLTQIIVESRGLGRLLPTALLTQLIRLGDDMLAEFFSRYVTWALQVYLQAKRFSPFAGRFAPPGFFSGPAPWGGAAPDWTASPAPEAGPEPAPEQAASASDVEDLRRQLAELREMLADRAK